MSLESSICGDPFSRVLLCNSTQGSEALEKGVGLQEKWLIIRSEAALCKERSQHALSQRGVS